MVVPLGLARVCRPSASRCLPAYRRCPFNAGPQRRSSATQGSSSVLTRGVPIAPSSSANPHAPVGKWLLGTAGVVICIVHVGGVTRLTRSGLSMTYWKPTQIMPPTTLDEWNVEFDAYKSFPEFSQRRSMTLEEFKSIYYWEWGHRILGRVSGLAFVLPAAYFAARRMIPSHYRWKLAGLLAMGGGQGFVGWWMVRSGLGEDRRDDAHEIRVSPYRLATHLSVAFATYTGLVWNGLDLLHGGADGRGVRKRYVEYAKALSTEARRAASKIRRGVLAATCLTALTAASGAFVAGMDAGLAYNTFPYMEEEEKRFVPVDIWDPELGFSNIFENTATVQFNHRLLAYSTVVASVGVAAYGLRRGLPAGAVSPQARLGLLTLGAAATGQASLGVATLLTYVPIHLAAAHQLGSLAVLSSGLYATQALRYSRPLAVRQVRQITVPGGSVPKPFAPVYAKAP
mmetsp:Transcript_8400/g.18427  ORF Transcript_8400/g.18427 Transcript_8400/m.18427 type:complete len:456 (-) Transcript_8400:245-1612(-)|eukprot:CAMPEP_0113309802 /NCGR_PEP_ID=MMETSP0010_2-20120614/7698_1 /TAXON_ID=216773 ORGANISM="Corethron hystrix, Strain 308" /NCGR_SAMPLE_ID=MMETSP0010_2 /ASSEMBLY_ACC=CAM_ASM_000155 /LENGTH=455 /DNA_ID=CAMNT_0000165123 /DNA_START=142 /DNA_END=1509 /DNA_ORIENTATION=+ /assembly_acc=CAM_ASM_000155